MTIDNTFAGQPLAELDQDGRWTDYVYAAGKRIAMVKQAIPMLHMYGSGPQGVECGAFAAYGLDYPIQNGDKLSWLEYKGNEAGGLVLWLDHFASGLAWGTLDTGGNPINQDSRSGQWVARTFDLSPYAGHTLSALSPNKDYTTPAGSWDLWQTDLAISSLTGAVTPIMSSAGTVGGIQQGGCQGTGTATLELQPNGTAPSPEGTANTHFYLGDHLGSAQLEFSSGGWPLSQTQYAPFGQEIQGGTSLPLESANGTANHYKFTGKERDAESGLDYFGARYYASNMGRWMSPDWADKPEAVPYSSLGNPQSLNLYGSVLNNPLSNADADGHDCCEALQQFASGFADTTYRPIVQAVSHPIDTGSAIISAAAHPINTATAIGNAVVDTGKAALSGDPKALGQVAGTVVSTLATAGAAKAISGLAEGAEVAGAASKVDSIVNAIDEGGFKVTGNAKGALQESNITITHPNEPGVKLNLRTETHPLEPGGNPVRHTNVERVEPGPKNRPEVKSNTHIDQ